MIEQKPDYNPSAEENFCPVLKNKVHCAQIEGTEASFLPEERRFEFCVRRCPVYKRQAAAAAGEERTKSYAPESPD